MRLSLLVTAFSVPVLSYLAAGVIYRGLVLTREASPRIRYLIVGLGQLHLAFVLAVCFYVVLGESSYSGVVYLLGVCLALIYTLCALGCVRAAVKLVSARSDVLEPGDWEMLSDRMVMLELYRVLASWLAGLTVRITGPRPLRQRLLARSAEEPLASQIDVYQDGSIDVSGIAEQIDQVPLEKIVGLFTTPLNAMFTVCRGFYGERVTTEANRLASTLPTGHRVFRDRPEILNRLFAGLLVNRAGTGTDLDRAIRGGVPIGSSILLASPTATERRFVEPFVERALEAGFGVIYVSSLHPPTAIQTRFNSHPYLHIVDLYTQTVREASNYTHRDRVYTCPNLEILPHAVTDAAENLAPCPSMGGRAVIDILTLDLGLMEVEEVWRTLTKITDTLRQRGITSLYTVNPKQLEDPETGVIKEIFDTIITVVKGSQEYTSIELQKGPPP